MSTSELVVEIIPGTAELEVGLRTELVVEIGPVSGPPGASGSGGGGGVPTTRQVIAGDGLDGGGTLAADRTLSVEWGTGTNQVRRGDDAAHTDARTPTAHKATHATGGSDPLTPGDIDAATEAQGALADTAVQPADLATVATSGSYTDLDDKPSIPDDPGDIGAASASDLTAHTTATTAAHGGIVASSDPRLTDARTPTAHASSHASAGSDPVTLAQSQVTNLTSDLAAKAPLASPAFTGTPTGITKTHVGLGNVDNTADASKTFGASQITSGTIATGRLGSGTANSSSYLRGDQTWASISAGGVYPFRPSAVWGIPNVTISGMNNTANVAGLSRPVMRLFRVDTAITVTDMAVEVHTLFSGCQFHIGLASITSTGGLGSILYDSGVSTLNATTTGIKSVTGLSISLTPGWYGRLFQRDTNGGSTPKWYSAGEAPGHGLLVSSSSMGNEWEDTTNTTYQAFNTSTLAFAQRGATGPSTDLTPLIFMKWTT